VEPGYVGVDLHRRRSVIVRKDSAGKVLETVQIANDPMSLSEVVARSGESPEVVLEATYGWYWAADVLAQITIPDADRLLSDDAGRGASVSPC
jgi:hypothetical protein